MDNTEPEATWAHTTQVEGKGQYRARGNMDTHDTGRRQTKHTNTILHSKPIRRIYETINKKRQFVGILITFVYTYGVKHQSSTNQFVCKWIDSLADRYVAPGKQYDE